MISTTLIEKMIDVGQNHFPNEFGGIVSGIVNNDNYIIFDFEVPDEFIQSPTGFTRHPNKLNRYLRNIHIETKACLRYLGEWHTHPDGSCNYSGNDFKSMVEIGGDCNVRFPSPILIIFSTGKKVEYNIYKLTNNKLINLNQREEI